MQFDSYRFPHLNCIGQSVGSLKNNGSNLKIRKFGTSFALVEFKHTLRGYPPPPRYEPRPGPGYRYPPGRPMPPPKVQSRVTGYVDGVTSDQRNVYVNGWACVTGYDHTFSF